jgi:NADPH:quinone reductase-like Zn-dependent oxidoreductase
VISDCHYTGGVSSRAAEGVPTNHGSKEYQVFHEDKVMCIPAEMPSEVAAAFTIGAQTSYSMIRKLGLSSGANVLVTAARSNTSLFVIAALQKHRVNVYATTTSMQLADRIRALGVKEVFQFDPAVASFTQNSKLCRAASEFGGFDAVVDPFFDLHLSKVLDVMAPCGRYVTCGLHDQHQRHVNPNYQFLQMNCQEVLVKVMMRNLQIIGNCLGLTEDLRQAVNDYSSGALNVVIDSVFTGSRVGDFFRRTYAVPERFGKVIYQYN